jgi:hypothetical protein
MARIAAGHQVLLEDQAVLAGWPTPVANDDNKSVEAHLAMKKRMGERDGSNANRTAITSLQVAAQLAGWPTPTTMVDGVAHTPERWAERAAACKARGVNLEKPLGTVAQLASWPTPTTRDHKDGDSQSCANVPVNALLGRTATLAGWATPNCMDALPIRSDEALAKAKTKAGCCNIKDQIPIGPPTPSSPAGTEKRGALNPAFSLWLMGYPKVWLVCFPEKK